jgi:hypothetical protein
VEMGGLAVMKYLFQVVMSLIDRKLSWKLPFCLLKTTHCI